MKNLMLLALILISFSACIPQEEEKSSKPEFIETEEFAARGLPFSEAVRVGNILFLSGQIGDQVETGKLVEGGIKAETKQTMLNIKGVLERNGSSMENIFKCTCMLADINEWADMSAEYIKFFPKNKPARSAFAATGLAMGARVEIECMAYVED
ncbi:Rid family hydrolase [Fulvivirga sp.]|uniref:RidA family protein n=1 Tax=Fulvivirga sp. TaxID=1931237 RepID=UPI0032EC247C